MKPRPDYQRRQAHRQRLALGRALHQVRQIGGRVVRGNHGSYYLRVPRIVRKHARMLRHTFAVLGS